MSTPIMPTTSSPSKWWTLPPELRNEIYTLAYSDAIRITPKTTPQALNNLVISKQWQQESLPIFHRHAEFEFAGLYDLLHSRLPPQATRVCWHTNCGGSLLTQEQSQALRKLLPRMKALRIVVEAHECNLSVLIQQAQTAIHGISTGTSAAWLLSLRGLSDFRLDLACEGPMCARGEILQHNLDVLGGQIRAEMVKSTIQADDAVS